MRFRRIRRKSGENITEISPLNRLILGDFQISNSDRTDRRPLKVRSARSDQQCRSAAGWISGQPIWSGRFRVGHKPDPDRPVDSPSHGNRVCTPWLIGSRRELHKEDGVLGFCETQQKVPGSSSSYQSVGGLVPHWLADLRDWVLGFFWRWVFGFEGGFAFMVICCCRRRGCKRRYQTLGLLFNEGDFTFGWSVLVLCLCFWVCDFWFSIMRS